MSAVARLAACALAAALGARVAGAQAPRFVESQLDLPLQGTRLLLADVDGDRRADVVRVDGEGVAVHLLDEQGRIGPLAEGRVAWPSSTVGWDLADVAGDGRTRLVLLVGGTRVVVHEAGAEGWDAGREVVDGVAGYLPPGVRRLRFARDVDGDGRADLAVPGASAYQVYLARDAGLLPPLAVTFDADVELDVGDPSRLGASLGQEVRIPWFALRDVDGDGRQDLVSETEERVAVYLAQPDGRYPATASWELDLVALEETDAERPLIDLDDLLSFLDRRVQWRVEDLDGAAPADLILQQGGRFRVYTDGSRGADLSRPDQVLKASGNIVLSFLRDTDGDGRLDLHIVRAETISLGRVVRWLVVAGSLAFDVFTYPNEGGTFARKPAARKTIEVRIPSILGFIEEAEALEEEVERRASVPAVPLDLDGDGRADDVVDLVEDELLLYEGLVPADFRHDYRELFTSIEEGIETLVHERLQTLGDEETLVIDLADPWSWMPTPAWELRQLGAGATPVARIPLGEARGAAPREQDGVLSVSREGRRRLSVRDVDGDRRGDLIVVEPVDEVTQRVRLFVRAR